MLKRKIESSFFFFKQTTAYEMRISDWSSDVCSSDLGSICTGAFTLGHAGLLEQRRVTTHWQNAGKLAAMFPQANVEADAIYIRDGRLITSAGVTAGIEMTLAIKIGRAHV